MWSVSSFAKFVVPTEVKISPSGTWIAYTIKRVSQKRTKQLDR